jgi:hypothetical protein
MNWVENRKVNAFLKNEKVMYCIEFDFIHWNISVGAFSDRNGWHQID